MDPAGVQEFRARELLSNMDPAGVQEFRARELLSNMDPAGVQESSPGQRPGDEGKTFQKP